MRSLNELNKTDRVLILAPHPDDESLATGGLIQKAIEVGAEVRIVFASNGDNNPWPQRTIEHKIWIGVEDRARWGARRKVEAINALDHLGVSPEIGARFLDFPDRGFTELLMGCEDMVISALQDEIEDFGPSLIVLPSPFDLHPDHSSLAVSARIALRRTRVTCQELYYLIHSGGKELVKLDVSLTLTPAQQEKKRIAILKHDSQMRLSRRRFLQFAKSTEQFHRADAICPSQSPHSIVSAKVSRGALEIQIDAPLATRLSGSLLVAMEGGAHGSIRYTLTLPESSSRVQVCDKLKGEPLRLATVRVNSRGVVVRIPIAQCWPVEQLFIKFQTASLFFDDVGWQEIPVKPLPALVPVPPAKEKSSSRQKLVPLIWTACAMIPLIWLVWAFSRGVTRPWVDVVGYNGAVWSQAAHNILRAGFVSTQGASSGFYFGALPIPPGGFYLHHPPLLHLLLTGLFSLFGEHEWVARSLPIGASLMSGIFLWLLVSNCAGARVATFCLAFFVCMPMELLYGRMVNFEPVILMLMLAGVLCLRYWRVSGNERWYWAAISVFLVGLWVDWAMHIFVLTMCVSWLFWGGSKKRRTAWYLFAATAFFGVLHLIRIRLLRPDAWSDLAHTFFKRVGTQSNVRFTEIQWVDRIYSNLGTHFLLVAWVLSLVGIVVVLLRKDRSSGYRFLGWSCLLIAITDLLFLCIFQNDSYIHRYIAYYLLVPLAILGGLGFDQIVTRLHTALPSGVVIRPLAEGVLVVSFFCFSAYSGLLKSDGLRDPFRILDTHVSEPPNLIPLLGETIRDNFPPQADVLCNFLPNYGPQLGYYAQRNLVNNLLDYSSWRNFLEGTSERSVGGVIWLGSPNAQEIVAHLPAGTRKYLTIDNQRFCLWKPRASDATGKSRQISNVHGTISHLAPTPSSVRPGRVNSEISQMKSI